jgi:hypothetical protein
MISVGSGTVGAVSAIDDEQYDWAISAEIAARVEAYGGLNAYCRDFNLDKRNFSKHIRGRKLGGRMVPSVPRTKALMGHIQNFGITPNEFFDSVNERIDRGN